MNISRQLFLFFIDFCQPVFKTLVTTVSLKSQYLENISVFTMKISRKIQNDISFTLGVSFFCTCSQREIGRFSLMIVIPIKISDTDLLSYYLIKFSRCDNLSVGDIFTDHRFTPSRARCAENCDQR